MSIESFVFYRSFYQAITKLEPVVKSRLFDAICEYALDGKDPSFDDANGVEYAIFTLVKPQLDANRKRRENGQKGGRPKTKPKPNNNLDKTKPEPNVNDNANVNDNEDIYDPKTNMDFEIWIQNYPLRSQVANAKRQYRIARNKVDKHVLLSKAKEYAVYMKDEPQKFIVNPAKWLEEQRYLDNYMPAEDEEKERRRKELAAAKAEKERQHMDYLNKLSMEEM